MNNQLTLPKKAKLNSKHIILIIIIISGSVPIVYASISEFNPYFQNPNVELKLDESNAVIIPNNVGHINKQYDHEEFGDLLQSEIKKAEVIRDKLVFSAIKDDR